MPKTIPQNTQASLSKSSFLDYLDEGRLTEWLTDYGKNILYVLAGLIGLLAIVYIFSSSQTSKEEQQYLQAAKDFTYFTQAYDANNPEQVQEAFNRLNKIMASHSNLHAAYDGGIAQTLLNRAKSEEALPFASATLTRIKSNDLPFYSDYAEATLLISQQKFPIALERAIALQQKMTDELFTQSPTRSFGDELFALNLLRIAMLQQEMGDKTAELKTWQEWKTYAGLNGLPSKILFSPLAFRSVIQQMAIGSISLPDYIAYRENILKK